MYKKIFSKDGSFELMKKKNNTNLPSGIIIVVRRTIRYTVIVKYVNVTKK